MVDLMLRLVQVQDPNPLYPDPAAMFVITFHLASQILIVGQVRMELNKLQQKIDDCDCESTPGVVSPFNIPPSFMTPRIIVVSWLAKTSISSR